MKNKTGAEKTEMNKNHKNTIVLIGNPNVGKSVIFGLLTGKYVVVSNYPGTTVEVTRGTTNCDDRRIPIIDTPGTNSLIPQSEDERVTRDILLNEDILNTIQVADAKNLGRGLSISIQLAEAGLPFILDLNMDDEARSRGIAVNRKRLSEILGVEVISTIATQRKGIKSLIKNLSIRRHPRVDMKYEDKIEDGLKEIVSLLPETNISERAIGLMLMAGDSSIKEYLKHKLSKDEIKQIDRICASVSTGYSKPLSYVISQQRQKRVDEILKEVMTQEHTKSRSVSSIIGKLAVHPVWGLPIVLAVMYLTYKVVGEFGAGTCVDFFESVVFGKYVNPAMTRVFSIIPIKLVQELFVGEYGMITMALTYAVAIVLPIVGFFFLIFGILEDSGYLPRLSIMVNRIFKVMGLNGKAVLPMILGLGCDTMATMTARILPKNKERIIVTLLLALAVPCSAQLGVIFGGTAAISMKATMIWIGTIVFVIFFVGYLSNLVIPGKSSDFILEIPPMRIPKLSNIVIKTLARLEWYLKEAVPLFMVGTLMLFVLSKTGLLKVIERLAAPVVVNLLQLPKETASAFVMGFLRRDYAAVLIFKGDYLTPIQTLVAIVTITLFVPCVANLFIMIKERGIKTAVAITSFVFVFAFLFGGAFNYLIRLFGVVL